MWYSDAVANLRKYTVSVVLLCGFLAPTAGAAASTINVAVCGDGAGAQLTITNPVSDSTVDHPNVEIAGTVAEASQIEITIDNEYDSTVPLDPQQTTFSTTVQLAAGTHTISLVANDICQVQNATASVVITYQPHTTPGTGQETPTTVTDDEGINITSQPVAQDPDSNKGIDMSSWPVIGPLARIGQDLAIALDFEIKGQPGGLWQSVVRFSFIVLGVSVALLGNAAVSAWGIINGSVTPKWRWGIRALGVLLIVLGFIF